MAQFKFNRATFKDKSEFISQGRRCATAVPNALQKDRVERELASVRAARIESVSINVQFTHITDGREGSIKEDQRVNQIEILNKAYSDYGIKFIYKPSSVITHNRPAWFLMGHRSRAEREAKMTLHVPPEYNLNFYTAGLQSGLLGWATFPWDLAGDRIMDGVVILYSSLPGGTAEPYNLGYTAVHEVGHWLGLYHTFQDGCDGSGDMVDDTVAHASPNYGCPEQGRNGACQVGEEAPIRNYMNYVDDSCMDEFTEGQIAGIKDHITAYRHDLMIGP